MKNKINYPSTDQIFAAKIVNNVIKLVSNFELLKEEIVDCAVNQLNILMDDENSLFTEKERQLIESILEIYGKQ